MRSTVWILTLWTGLVAQALCAEGEVTRERYPDADAVLVDSFEDIRYNPDGTYTTREKQTIKVLTEKGRREESEVTLRYSARYAKSAIESVSVKSADGTVREVDVAATTKESTDNSSASENIYDPMHRKLVCTVPGVEVGDEITYVTSTEIFQSRIKDQWADSSMLEWSMPAVKWTVRITSPKDRPLKSIALRHPLDNVTYAEEELPDGSIARTWTAKDSPQAFPEPDMPPLYTQVQHVRVSTAADWREISRWYWDISLPHLEKTTAAISNKVAEIGCDIAALYKWVAQEIRYMGLTMEAESPGYAPHDVDITFENRYGVCRDKAALLVAMLRLAGFEAYPVLIHAGAKMDPDVPMPYFNHAIVAVALPPGGVAELGLAESDVRGAGRYVLMDPTDESSRDLLPSYLSDRSFLVARPEGETLLTSSVPDASSNAVRIRSRGILDRDGSLLLDSRISFGGINDNVYRQGLLRRKGEARRKLFERLLLSVASGAELLDFRVSPGDLQDTTQPLEVSLLSRIPETLLTGETRVELSPVMLSRVLGQANWLLEGKTSLESRKYPLVIDSTAMVEEELSVELGQAVGAPVDLPRDVEIDGAYAYTRKSRVENGRYVCNRRFAINAVEFSPEDYRAIREGAKRVEAAERERPVFERNDGSDANSRVLFNREIVNVSAPDAWVVTNTVCRKVLTYDGKKKYSELKFSYNPEWRQTEVISAVVSNATGKVVAATEREMNTFDCSWAASAPRYPASRQLIVNLPGVEVGSVITYTVVSKVEGAPRDFYASWYFDAFEPADEITLVLNGETNTVRNAKLLTSEPMMAVDDLCREKKIVSYNDFARAAKSLKPVVKVKPLRTDKTLGAPWGESVQSIRDWMAKNVRVEGPSLYETPLVAQTTDPQTVVHEGYASRLDYVRTLCALLKGAGFDAKVVFSSLDAEDLESLRERDMYETPNVGAFAYPLCRVRAHEGGFLCFGGTWHTYYIGIENEYTPLGTTPYDGSHYFDPEDASFGLVEADADDLKAGTGTELVISLRENGAADVDVVEETWGAAVGAFRKKYEEMLPEDRLRHHQELLGNLSQAASATSELETDTTGYPARLAFKAYVPDFAVVSKDAMTITPPAFYEQIFPLVGGIRRNPLGVDAANAAIERVRIVFPAGYSEIEHMPEDYVLVNPDDPDSPWFEFSSQELWETAPDGSTRLVIELERVRAKRDYAALDKAFAPLLREWTRFARAKAGRTVIVRKTN